MKNLALPLLNLTFVVVIILSALTQHVWPYLVVWGVLFLAIRAVFKEIEAKEKRMRLEINRLRETLVLIHDIGFDGDGYIGSAEDLEALVKELAEIARKAVYPDGSWNKVPYGTGTAEGE